MVTIVAEPVGHDQLDHLATFLRSEELPDDDISLPNRHFFFFKDEDGQFLGIGGFEIHGSDALLRSVVTAPEVRGQGHGMPMVEALLNEMRGHGAESVYLLTTTAGGFFSKFGFAEITRDEVPPGIKATQEYALLCPADALVMRRKLTFTD